MMYKIYDGLEFNEAVRIPEKNYVGYRRLLYGMGRNLQYRILRLMPFGN